MDAHIKYYFKDISLGQTAEYEKQVTDEDVRKFADISGDYNPIHLDDEFAKDSMFGARIAHGILTASHISAVIGYIFPGPGWIYLGQSLQFRAPVKIGDTVHTAVEVTDTVAEKNIVELSTICKVGDTVVLKGTATIKSPD
ncbi:MAG: hypothetical protein CMM45_04130 [Rhodospirillaceae bacterium]|nr:hypothetical protein [Rhodospirillaceae bacterium]